MPTLVLASTSVYRRQLLDRLGLEAVVTSAPTCDEEALKEAATALAPVQLAVYLAREKARSVPPCSPGAHILGCDQLVELDGEVLGKPGSSERAVEQLARLQGRSHRLITAFVLLHPDGSVTEHVDEHVLHMRALSRAELERYVAADRPFDCAGSYKIEDRGITLFEHIAGSDFTAIVGLPLVALTSALRARGFAVP